MGGAGVRLGTNFSGLRRWKPKDTRGSASLEVEKTLHVSM